MNRKETTDALRLVRRRLAESALIPIKKLVQSGKLTPDDALDWVIQETDQLSEKEFSPEYRRFIAQSGKVFEGEQFFESGYDMAPGSDKYRPSSQADRHFLFKLWEHAGRQQYYSPEQLREVMNGILEGKRLLELGCGVGFGLDVFARLGAKPVGVELRHDYEGRLKGVDIRYGDARNLWELVGEEQFDLVYSNDFFATACIEAHEANKVATGLFDATAYGGSGFHVVTYRKFNPMAAELVKWVAGYKTGNTEMYQQIHEMVGEEEVDDIMGWTNECSLDPQYLARRGFRITEYGIEDGDLVMVTTKPGYPHQGLK